MHKSIDKGKKKSYDQTDLMGIKPYGNIGPGRTAMEAKVVRKLKKKKVDALRAKGSTIKSGQMANAVGDVSAKIRNFVNR